VEAITGFSQATTTSQPLHPSRRGEDVVLGLSARTSGAEPVAQRRAVEPVFRRPRLEGAAHGTAQPAKSGAGQADAAAAKAAEQKAAEAAAAPAWEWLDLEIIPLGQKPDPRGYAIYAQKPQPQPVPVILIETA
jgi:hypothetical protein